MKLYQDNRAPNPRRVRIFLAEKGMSVPVEQVSLPEGEHRTPEFRRMSPQMLIPVLELDDGTCITETVAICRYFEETRPDPRLMGETPLEKANIEMWQRRMEMNLFLPIAFCFRHTHPRMAERETQITEWGELNRKRAGKMLDWLDGNLADGRPHLAGDGFSIADITGAVAVDFAALPRIETTDRRPNLKAWHERVSARDSMQA